MNPRHGLFATLAAVLLGGCQTGLPYMADPAEVVTRNAAPPGAEPGTCWGRDETPAVVETVTEQVMLQPAEILADGTVSRPAAYKTETRQQIVKPREATWFETPCEEELTEEFNASLQRALKARGHYRGPVTGRMDSRTRAAIRAYQKPQGLDSGVISLAAARQMGLVLAETPDVEREITPSPLELAALEAQQALRAEEDAAREATRAQAARDKAEREAAEQARQEAARQARAQAAEEARKAKAEAKRAEQAREARRQAELEAALEAERARKTAAPTPLPISSETTAPPE